MGSTTKRKNEQGYALIVVSLMATLLLLSVITVAPSVRTENQREKEQEMIWRGKQYVRGIKLYYRKTGRFPTSLDDLTKPKTGSIRFMRQAYKDPMNRADGAWRLIYVGPAGQLIGSLKPQQTLQIPGIGGAPAANPNGTNPTGTSSGFGSSAFGQTGFGQSGSAFGQSNQSGTSAFGQSNAQAGASGGAQNAASQGGSNAPGQSGTTDNGTSAPAAQTFSSDSPLLGGNIIGVGSTIDKRSLIVYDKAKNYHLFEFVWNPSKDLANAIQNGLAQGGQNPPAAGQGTGAGQSGFGQSGFGQQSTPPANQQNPPGLPEPTPGQPPPQL